MDLFVSQSHISLALRKNCIDLLLVGLSFVNHVKDFILVNFDQLLGLFFCQTRRLGFNLISYLHFDVICLGSWMSCILRGLSTYIQSLASFWNHGCLSKCRSLLNIHFLNALISLIQETRIHFHLSFRYSIQIRVTLTVPMERRFSCIKSDSFWPKAIVLILHSLRRHHANLRTAR